MNRRNFIKTATAALGVIALSIKQKTSEIVTGVGRGSPRVIDSFGGIAVPPHLAKTLLAANQGDGFTGRAVEIATVSNGEIIDRFDVPIRPIEFDWRKTDMRERLYLFDTGGAYQQVTDEIKDAQLKELFGVE